VRLTGVEEGRGRAGSIELGEGGRDDRGQGEELGSSGRSFYRSPGWGRGREVACTGEDGGTQWRRRDGSGRGLTGWLGWRKVPTG
jgi:hypothetical protein